MGLFSRKQETLEKAKLAAAEREHERLMEELAKPPCQRRGGKHMYRDFPPYLWYSYSGQTNCGKIVVYEPYCCCLCGDIRRQELDVIELSHYNKENFMKEVKRVEELYKDFIKPKAIVMDMVHDAQLVDRQKLKYWDQLHSPDEPKQETEEERLTRYKIELLGGKKNDPVYKEA